VVAVVAHALSVVLLIFVRTLEHLHSFTLSESSKFLDFMFSNDDAAVRIIVNALLSGTFIRLLTDTMRQRIGSATLLY
jgi:hypothetical protein